MGNGPFAVPTLKRLLGSAHEVVQVVTRPDRPQGKHRRVERGPVAQAADSFGLPVSQPVSVNSAEAVSWLSDLAGDLLVVADFGQILSTHALGTARLGGINVHASLLPKYRGAAPVAWAIYHGESETGVSIIQMTRELDAGGVVKQQSTPIGPDETAGELEARLADLGAELAASAIEELAVGRSVPIPQSKGDVTLAPRLSKESGRIDWNRSAQEIHDQVRAMIPWPVAFAHWPDASIPDHRFQVVSTRVTESKEGGPGEVLGVAGGLHLATGKGGIILKEVRPAGRRLMTGEEFARGARLVAGSRLA
jgi:methionyl-tRNA formyltransferase